MSSDGDLNVMYAPPYIKGSNSTGNGRYLHTDTLVVCGQNMAEIQMEAKCQYSFDLFDMGSTKRHVYLDVHKQETNLTANQRTVTITVRSYLPISFILTFSSPRL